MIRLDANGLNEMEAHYPGIREMILRFDAAVLPSCSRCGSDDTVDLQIGVTGRTIKIAAATSKVHLIANGPKPGDYFCNACRLYFD